MEGQVYAYGPIPGLGPRRRQRVNGQQEALDGHPGKPGMYQCGPSNAVGRSSRSENALNKEDRPGVVSPAVRARRLD